MNLYLMIAIFITNIIAISMVYNFVKRLSKREVLVFIAISVALMYILVSMVYWISGFGIDDSIHQSAKNFVIYLFVPVNVIIIIPYFASKYMKLREKKIGKEELVKKLRILVLILVLVLVAEYFYFCNIQKNIKSISNESSNKNNTQISNDVSNEISNEINNKIGNEIQSNQID